MGLIKGGGACQKMYETSQVISEKKFLHGRIKKGGGILIITVWGEIGGMLQFHYSDAEKNRLPRTNKGFMGGGSNGEQFTLQKRGKRLVGGFRKNLLICEFPC